jgi:hypothetical protein
MSQAIDFLSALGDWTEPTWGCTSNRRLPQDHSSDNALLFTATSVVHLRRLLKADAQAQGQNLLEYRRANSVTMDAVDHYVQTFSRLVRACEIQPGLYKRYPGVPEGPTTHDDLTGIAVASYLWGLPFGEEILDYARKNKWCWYQPFRWKEYLYLPRIPDFAATIKRCGNEQPNLVEQWAFKQALHWNVFEDRKETSGKCLVYLKAKACWGVSIPMDDTISRWRDQMQLKYRYGMKDVYSIYFGADHPISVFAPENFQ